MTKGPGLNHKIYLNPENLRALKEPFGILLEAEKINRKSIVEFTKRAVLVASVGDATTDRLWSFGLVPNIFVVDGREQRFERGVRGGESLTSSLNFECYNPPGCITENAIRVLHAAINNSTNSNVRVIVRGEEDLLVLPILMMIPYGSVVMYGQPCKGIVIICVDPRMRNKAKHLMERFGIDWKRGYDDAVAE